MSKIAFIVPFQEMEQQIRRAWEISENESLEANLYPDHQFEYTVQAATLSAGSPPPDIDADVIVARGATALGLKRLYMHQDKHVVEIPVTAADLVSTIRRAIKRWGNLPIAVTGTFNMTYGSSGVNRANRYNVQVYHSDRVDDRSYEEMVLRAQADGCRIIIGGMHTTAYARSLGLYGERLSTSIESFLQAISAAKSAAVIAEKERQRSALYQAIITHTYSGILSYTEDNQVIVMNSAARLLLGLRDERPGKALNELLSPGAFRRLLLHPGVFKDKITEYQGSTLVVSKARIPLGGSENGYLATFQDAAAFVQYLNDELSGSFSVAHVADMSFSDLVAASSSLRGAISDARRLAASDKNILITGETGTGKSAFAQAIHNARPHTGLFLRVDCATLNREKLMGISGQPGVLELANNGTLYLRQVGSLSPQMQELLREILSGSGALLSPDGKTVPLKLHIISSTSRDLAAMTRAGTFSPELYYLLSTLVLELTPLRSRTEDIVPLMEHSLSRRLGRPPRFRPAVRELLEKHPWYGNMHELLNCCERLCTLDRDGAFTESDILENVLRESLPEPEGDDLEGRLEKRRILDALAKHGMSRTDAAAALGMSRTTLWRKLKKYGITE
ncbi:MAG: sigma 54-interacting transcriptional regulator [Candidatus Heteroscillospira sp.]|jgi:transcriptional regulator with PAS, ATPase and Fis domain